MTWQRVIVTWHCKWYKTFRWQLYNNDTNSISDMTVLQSMIITLWSLHYYDNDTNSYIDMTGFTKNDHYIIMTTIQTVTVTWLVLQRMTITLLWQRYKQWQWHDWFYKEWLLHCYDNDTNSDSAMTGFTKNDHYIIMTSIQTVMTAWWLLQKVMVAWLWQCFECTQW